MMRSWSRVLVILSLVPLAGCLHCWGCHPWWGTLTGRSYVVGGPIQGIPAGGPVVEGELGPIFAAPPGAEMLKSLPTTPLVPPAPNVEAPPSPPKELAPPPRPESFGQPSLAKPIMTRTAANP